MCRAAGLEPAPRQTVIDPMIPATLSFTMPDGFVLPARDWLPPAGVPWRGVIVALHGFTDSRDGWEIPAPVFAQAGYAVFAPDQRGFGGTADRGGWAGTQRLVDDAVEVMRQLRARYPGKPVVLMGESMGGAVAALVAARPGPGPDATVLLAPAVWGPGQMDPALFATLVLADAVAPDWVPHQGRIGEDIWASDNIPALIRFGRDPLTLREVSVRSLRGLVTLMGDAHAAMGRLHGRVLILDGRRDQLLPPTATASAWEHLPAGVRRGFYPSGYHLLLRDRDRALVGGGYPGLAGRPGPVFAVRRGCGRGRVAGGSCLARGCARGAAGGGGWVLGGAGLAVLKVRLPRAALLAREGLSRTRSSAG